ncbi:MAG: hypothetical protein EPN82_11420 [Bacteroidetes bacterium]|nr:MAG: hypothetical protein EPN82_11420 [Bacteroidota bacterium]
MRIFQVLIRIFNLIPFFMFIISTLFNPKVFAQELQSPFNINEISGNVFTNFDRNNYGLFPFAINMNYTQLFNNQSGKIDAKIIINDSTTYYVETNYTPEMFSNYLAFIDRYYNSKNGDLFSEQGSQVVINFNNGDELLSQIISVRDSSILISKNNFKTEKDLLTNTKDFNNVLLKDINTIVIKKNNKIWYNVISGLVVGSLFGYIFNAMLFKMTPEDLQNLLNSKTKIQPAVFFTLTFGTIGAIIGALTYANENTMHVKELGTIPVRAYAIYPHQMLEPDIIKNIP